VDQEILEVNYADPFVLMRDLRGMGEGNAQRSKRPYVPRDTFYAMAAAYQAMYGNPDGSIPATFQVVQPPSRRENVSINSSCAGCLYDWLEPSFFPATTQGKRERRSIAKRLWRPSGRTSCRMMEAIKIITLFLYNL